MSIYEPEYDAPLLSAPWHSLPSTGKANLILKYTSHPSRPGYIILLTELSSVYCEVLTGPSVPSRMIEVEREFHSDAKKKGKGKGRHDDIDEDDVIGRSNAALKDVGEIWNELEEAKVEMRSHDYHDGVLSIQTDDFSWLFYLTELKGRLPLELITKHLIGPLAGILMETNNVQNEGNLDPSSLVHTLFHQSPTITQHLTHHHLTSSRPVGSKAQSKAASPLNTTKSNKSPAKVKPKPRPSTPVLDEAEEEEEEQAYESDEDIAASHAIRSRDTPKEKGGPSGATPKGKSTNNTAKSVSPGPAAHSKPSSNTAASRNVTATKASPAQTKSRHIIASDDEDIAEEEEEEQAEEGSGSRAGSELKEKTPTPPPAPSQMAKKERERLEEEEMKERADAMKRKMEGGGGGGNLGRRRLRR